MPERPEVFYAVSTAGFDVVEKPLSAWEKLYDNGAVRKTALLVMLAAAWELYARWLNNPLLVPTFSATVGAFFASVASGALPQAAVYTISMLLKGICGRAGDRGAADRLRHGHAHRSGSSGNAHRHVQSPALDRAAAAGADLVRTGRGKRDFRADPRRAVGRRAEHLRGLSLGESDVEDGRAELRVVADRLHRADSDSRRVPQHPDGPQGRLGLRLAHAHRRRAGVRRQLRIGRTGLVYFRAQESAFDRRCLRRIADRDPVRPGGREPDLQDHREPHRAPVGHADRSVP